MFVVTLRHNGNLFFLRSTVWTSEQSRATTFATQAEADAGRAKAKQFMKAAQFKAAKIEELR